MRVLVAMSGGVDSSVAAGLLCQEGHSCVGCTMRLYTNEDAGLTRSRTCCSLEDAEDAGRVARRLGMPFYVFNFTEDFRREVILPFADAYARGETPNPCIECNRRMKFGKLFSRAADLECDAVATGHYARIVPENGRYVLKKALDESKDQSYVLYGMTQLQLAHTLFPLGNLRKTDVRRLAAESGFSTADKPDSQDICFVPDGNYARVVEQYRGAPTPGDFIDRNGVRLGMHRGICRYTVGQHKGLGLSLPRKLYVCEIDPVANTVMLGTEQELYTTEAAAIGFNWISGETPAAPVVCRARTRYRQPEADATVYPQGDAAVRIRFAEPQRAVTPGQAVVLYDGDTVLGGGTLI